MTAGPVSGQPGLGVYGALQHLLAWGVPGMLEPSQPASCCMTPSSAGSKAAGMQHSWQTLRQHVTCKIDSSQGIDVVVYIGRVRATLAAVGAGKLGLGALKPDAQLIPAWHRMLLKERSSCFQEMLWPIVCSTLGSPALTALAGCLSAGLSTNQSWLQYHKAVAGWHAGTHEL